MRWFAGLLVTLAAAASARADDAKHVDVAFHGAIAQLTVTFEMRQESLGRTDSTLFAPPNAVVTGGVVRDSAGSHTLALVRSDDATRTYDALSNAAPGRARASFVEVSQRVGDPRVEVTILAPRPETYTVELTFEAPTCLQDDMRYVAVPLDWESGLSRTLQDTATANACGGAENAVFIGVASSELAGRKPGADRIGVSAARFATKSAQAARLDLAIAGTLSAVPPDLHTVLVVDTSRSVTDHERDVARAVVKSYLDQAPRSSVQVVTYARTATALLPEWSRAGANARAIDQQLANVTPRNGSELPAALREASTWLAKVNGTRRVVIISDARVADRIAAISTTALAHDLPARTLVHVVALDGNEELTRDDNARWADLAAATEGIATSVGSSDVDATALVRPISLDHLEIEGRGLTALAKGGNPCGASLLQGTSCSWWATGPGSDAVTVRGLLWNHRWSKRVPLGSRRDVHIARQLSFILDDADPLAIEALRAARAVNGEWSLTAQWGGSGGYNDVGPEGGAGWGATCDCGPIGTIGHGSGTGTAPLSPTWLRDQLASAVGACTRTGVTISLTVELTREEIVDVTAKVSGAGADLQRIESCATEAVWNANVTPPRLDEHQTQQVTF